MHRIQQFECNKFYLIKKSQKGEGFTLCMVCRSDFSVANREENDITRCKDTSKLTGYFNAAQQKRKLTDLVQTQ